MSYSKYHFAEMWVTMDIGYILGVFDNRSDAEAVGRAKGEWQADIVPVQWKCIVIDDSEVYILLSGKAFPLNVDIEKQRKELRRAALAKLTSEERAILGLTE